MQKITTTLGACVAALALAPAASAGTADIYLCQTAAGQPNGPVTGVTGQTVGQASVADTCSLPGGSITGTLTGPGPWFGGSVAEQTIAAPAGTVIDRIRAQRKVQGLAQGADGAARIAYTLQNSVGGDIERREPFSNGLGSVDSPYDSGTAVALATNLLRAYVSCNWAATQNCVKPNGAQPQFDLSNLILTVRDDTAPNITDVGGALTEPGAKSGTVPIAVTATDSGLGIYRTFVKIDGVNRPSSPVGGPPCRDARPNTGSAFEFNDLRPCPTAPGQLTVPLDTTTLSEGPHTIEVLVQDAAGNTTTAWGPQTIIVDNKPECADGIDNDGDGRVDYPSDPGCDSPTGSTESPDPECGDRIDNDGDGRVDYPADPACDTARDTTEAGTPTIEAARSPIQTVRETVTITKPAEQLNGQRASQRARLVMWFVRTKSSKNTSYYGQRVVMRGRLTNARGRGISGARIDLSHLVGARTLAKTGQRTRAGGHITFIAPMNITTRKFVFAYRYRLTDDNPVASVALSLNVKPRPTAVTVEDREGR